MGLALLYYAAMARIVSTKPGGGIQLGPVGWALAGAGLVGGKVYRKPWAMVTGGLLALAGVGLLIAGGVKPKAGSGVKVA